MSGHWPQPSLITEPRNGAARWQPRRRGPVTPGPAPRGSTPGTLPGATGRPGDHPWWQHQYQDPSRSSFGKGAHASNTIQEAAMSATEVHNASRDAAVGKVGMHLEVEIIPVSDVDRSKEFYRRLGWRLDDDVARSTAFASSSSPPGLRCLGHLRHGTHDGRARLARGGADRLRHRSGP